MLPNKLQHGDSFARLFDLWNQLIDYLRETRLVAGHGIRINKHSAGITIESTATATGGTQSAPAGNPHPFDVELVKGGTEESPSYSVKVFDSALPDSPYAGTVYIGRATFSVPVDELGIQAGGAFFVDLVITYDAETDPVYTLGFEVRTDPYTADDNNVYRQTIAEGAFAEGALPAIASLQSGNITVTGRWV
ncbi:MAG: hypothetical protein IKO93_22370 [Lentisphaeria bacterium]|nr:hypothetical protein [Lentisphaeria bacterium]